MTERENRERFDAWWQTDWPKRSVFVDRTELARARDIAWVAWQAAQTQDPPKSGDGK